MNISIVRGDTEKLSFYRKDKNGEIIKTMPKKLYFSVKSNSILKKVIFQKTLDDMEFDSETGKFSFFINPEDTNNLSYGNYEYDIEVKDTIESKDYVKTISLGTLQITKEITFSINEV